ncbi:MAG: PRC-barrel domain-containing protein [Actinomycetota bacterium]
MTKMPISMLLRGPNDAVEVRCCSDEPMLDVRPARSMQPSRRWVRKLRSAVPASLAAFRGTLRTPVDSPALGSKVVTGGGTNLGHVKDVVVGLRTGKTSYEVSHGQAAPGDAQSVLVPRDAMRESAEDDVFVADVDEERLVRIA